MDPTRSCWVQRRTLPSAAQATTAIRSCNTSSVLWTERSFGRRPSKEASCVTTRGGDFELTIGQDISIGYLSHSETTVDLYLQETFTFRLLTTEAAVVLAPQATKVHMTSPGNGSSTRKRIFNYSICSETPGSPAHPTLQAT